MIIFRDGNPEQISKMILEAVMAGWELQSPDLTSALLISKKSVIDQAIKLGDIIYAGPKTATELELSIIVTNYEMRTYFDDYTKPTEFEIVRLTNTLSDFIAKSQRNPTTFRRIMVEEIDSDAIKALGESENVFTAKQAAKYLGSNEDTLGTERHLGIGPRFHKKNGFRIVYFRHDLDNEKTNGLHSSSEKKYNTKAAIIRHLKRRSGACKIEMLTKAVASTSPEEETISVIEHMIRRGILVQKNNLIEISGDYLQGRIPSQRRKTRKTRNTPKTRKTVKASHRPKKLRKIVKTIHRPEKTRKIVNR